MPIYKHFKILIAQKNFTAGDIEGNYEKILDTYKRAQQQDVDLVVFSELALTGYPPEDLALRMHFQWKCFEWMEKLSRHTDEKTGMIVGGIFNNMEHNYNALYLLHSQDVQRITMKRYLPNYSVFDEIRTFHPGPMPHPVEFKKLRLGLMVCEDMWDEDMARHLYAEGAQILICCNASPFAYGKLDARMKMARMQSKRADLGLIYVNQVGGQDDLVFDGGSFIAHRQSGETLTMKQFEEQEVITSWYWKKSQFQLDYIAPKPQLSRLEQIIRAIKLAIKDYVEKNNFPGVLIGMSGGIDSALTAALAVDAIGKDKVHLVMLPSKYTSKESLKDAKECANLLGAKYDVISIENLVSSFDATLEPFFKGTEQGLTEENIQARIRGVLLMALSNKFGKMLLTTGNKSELAVGYATLYGDMCGGFNPLKDVYKTQVYEIAEYINKQKLQIPKNIIDKAPSAELRPNQKDQDSLPHYDVLDEILKFLIEERLSVEQTLKWGDFDREQVRHVANLLISSEHKRRQSPPGPRLTEQHFGKDRRFPITHGYTF